MIKLELTINQLGIILKAVREEIRLRTQAASCELDGKDFQDLLVIEDLIIAKAFETAKRSKDVLV